MLKIGQMNSLEMVKTTDFGIYLDGGPFGEILLPKRYVPQDATIGKDLDVFIYSDSEDRLIATTETPLAMCGEFAYLKVKDNNQHGAFLDWGLPKDLFVPFKEQLYPMEVGRSYVVRVYLDEASSRIAATTKLNKFLEPAENLNIGDPVEALIFEMTDIGFRAIVNGAFSGLIFKNEAFQKIKIGDKLTAFIKNIREDKRLDLTLQREGYRQRIPDANDILLEALHKNNGFLKLDDGSSPEQIYDTLKMSKKTFKKAVGSLYKQRLIQFENDGIQLLENNETPTPIDK